MCLRFLSIAVLAAIDLEEGDSSSAGLLRSGDGGTSMQIRPSLHEVSERDQKDETRLSVEEADRFSFGRVRSCEGCDLVICEYDFSKDADVLQKYRLSERIEYSGLKTAKELSEGDDVVVNFTVVDGVKVVHELCLEERGNVGELNAYAVIQSANETTLKVLEYDCLENAEVEMSYTLDSETRFIGFDSLEELGAFDDVELSYDEVEGVRVLRTIQRTLSGDPQEMDSEPVADRVFSCIVRFADTERIQLEWQTGLDRLEEPLDCEMDQAPVLKNLEKIEELRVGDSVDILLRRQNGAWKIIGMTRH